MNELGTVLLVVVSCFEVSSARHSYSASCHMSWCIIKFFVADGKHRCSMCLSAKSYGRSGGHSAVAHF